MIIKKTLHGIKTAWKGLALTLRHIVAIKRKRKSVNIKADNYFDESNGQVTVQYPREKLPVPEVGRYQLDVEMEDCIVCDLCARICPVDCIEIESIKATAPIGQTSDGSTKRLYAAKFDIDMSKCFYCGLCTTVCPTECITMTSEYDRSFTSLVDMTYKFGTMTPGEAEQKRAELAADNAKKQAAKAAVKEQIKE